MSKEEFLKRYEALCREAGLIITSCGCCNGPNLCDVDDQLNRMAQNDGHADAIAENVKHLLAQSTT